MPTLRTASRRLAALLALVPLALGAAACGGDDEPLPGADQPAIIDREGPEDGVLGRNDRPGDGPDDGSAGAGGASDAGIPSGDHDT